MSTPPQFPAQQHWEQVLEQYKEEQKEEQKKFRREIEDLREERKMALQKSSIFLSAAALAISLIFGVWNATVSYRSLSIARRGFVAVKLAEVSTKTKMTFEVKAVPPNPALHIAISATCATYVENGRQPEQALTVLSTYENNLTLAPGDSRSLRL